MVTIAALAVAAASTASMRIVRSATVCSTAFIWRCHGSGISIGTSADQEDMIRAMTFNRLQPVIDRCFPLQEIGAAFTYYESQQHFGKVCLEL